MPTLQTSPITWSSISAKKVLWTKWSSGFAIAIRYKWRFIAVVMALMLLYVDFRIYFGESNHWIMKWVAGIESGAKFATFVIAFAIWFYESREKFEAEQPKRLFAVFLVPGTNDPWLCCENAPLLGESDLRPFAQQIGRQMTMNADLLFSPRIITWDEIRLVGDEVCHCYFAAFRLEQRRSPSKVEEDETENSSPFEWRDKIAHHELKKPRKSLQALPAEKKFRYWNLSPKSTATYEDLSSETNTPAWVKNLPRLPPASPLPSG